MRRRVLAGGAAALVLAAAVWLALPDTVTVPRDRPIGAIVPGAAGIAVLGTSLSHRTAWPDDLAAALVDCGLPALPVTRVTRPGAHSGWGRENLAPLIAAKPALVLIEFTVNDADIRDGLSRAGSLANHRAIAAELQGALPEARLAFLTMNQATGLRRLSRPFLARYDAALADLAAELDLGFVDLAPRWHAFLGAPEGAGAIPDGLHPTDAAFAAVGRAALTGAVARAWGLPGCAPG